MQAHPSQCDKSGCQCAWMGTTIFLAWPGVAVDLTIHVQLAVDLVKAPSTFGRPSTVNLLLAIRPSEHADVCLLTLHSLLYSHVQIKMQD